MRILALESSCDETAAAVVEDGRTVLSNVVASQVEEHRLYAAWCRRSPRARHCEAVCGITREALAQAGMALQDVDALAVSAGPGSSARCSWA